MFKRMKKIYAVMIALAVACAGIVLVGGSEESEAVTTQTPFPAIVMDAHYLYTEYYNGTTSYLVAYGTYVYINSDTGIDYDYLTVTLTSSYGDTAGLVLTDNGAYNNVLGTVDKTTSGTISLTIRYIDGQNSTDDYVVITLNVLDTTSSTNDLWFDIDLPANVAYRIGTFYACVGASVSIDHTSVMYSTGTLYYLVTDVSPGYGLSVDANGDLTGTISSDGTIQIEITESDGIGNDAQYYFTISVPSNHADVYLNGGDTWTYTPYTSISAILSISGTATSWVSLSNGVISGTAPTNIPSTEVYHLTITATTSNPVQTIMQTVDFTVNPLSDTNVRMLVGEYYEFSPVGDNPDKTITDLTGSGTVWVMTNGSTLYGTAPIVPNVGTLYYLDVEITETVPGEPLPTVTHMEIFITVDPLITVTGPGTTQNIPNGSGSTADIISSNFEDGAREIYSVSGLSGYTIDAEDGIISYNDAVSGYLTVTATSPYAYSSGATNTASTSVVFEVQGSMLASVSGTLYLVTGKTVPNTPAENVTLSHTDIGVGTYTWSVVGTNNSGVTVASDGTLGGTPGAVGNYSITVRCTAVVGGDTQTADAILNISIVPVLVFTTSPSFAVIS